MASMESMSSAADVARYFVALDATRPEPDVTPLKLAKLLYFAQANNLADTGCRLFDAPIEAFDNGPVVYEVWKRGPKNAVILAAADSQPRPEDLHGTLPEHVTQFLDRVWSRFGDMSASRLWAMTHRHAPYLKYYVPSSYRVEIPDTEMRDWFRCDAPFSERVHRPDVAHVSSGVLEHLDDDEVDARFAALFG